MTNSPQGSTTIKEMRRMQDSLILNASINMLFPHPLEASGFGQPTIDEIKQAFFGISALWPARSEKVFGAFHPSEGLVLRGEMVTGHLGRHDKHEAGVCHHQSWNGDAFGLGGRALIR